MKADEESQKLYLIDDFFLFIIISENVLLSVSLVD